MKILILGANGKTGTHLVDQALQAGHTVSAYVRDPGKVSARHDRLCLIQGQLHDVGALEKAMTGQDAVLSALGHRNPMKKDWMLSEVTERVIGLMKRTGVKRFIYESAFGTNESYVDLPLWFKLLRNTLLRGSFADHEQAESFLRGTHDTSWTIARPAMLTDGPQTGIYQVVDKLTSGTGSISRADVAHFMLRAIDDPKCFRKALALSY